MPPIKRRGLAHRFLVAPNARKALAGRSLEEKGRLIPDPPLVPNKYAAGIESHCPGEGVRGALTVAAMICPLHG